MATDPGPSLLDEIPGHGFVYAYDGRVSRATYRAAARARLVNAHGRSALDADELVIDRPNLVARAWYDRGRGFVQEGHGGQAVVVVHALPEPAGPTASRTVIPAQRPAQGAEGASQ